MKKQAILVLVFVLGGLLANSQSVKWSPENIKALTPEWCQNPEIKINGTAIDAKQGGSEFIRVSRLWKKNDKITLHFPMNVKVVKGRETPYPQISYFDRFRKMAKDTTINNPYECVYYGPLLFSLAIPDEDPNKEMPNAKFNYA
ncbi:MAG: hypothetical protein WC854_13665, partial [Bacteroidales bacterium]